MENWDLGEARYGDEKGFLLVTVRDGAARAQLHPVKRRPVLLPTIDCTGARDLDDVLRRVRNAASTWTVAPETAVQAALDGLPPFEVEARAVVREIEKTVSIAAADVILRYAAVGGDVLEESELPREIIEREEIERLIRERGVYGGHVELVRELVRAVLSGRADEELFAELLASAKPWIEKQNHEAPATAAPERQVVR
jgi:Arc/MetJ-type ribon-helix-helix transcriptional regulator